MTAVALAAAGITVTVLERRTVLDEAGAGLQLAPNATRILHRLGLLDRLMPRATEPDAVRIRRLRDGAEVSRLPLGQIALRRYGAPFLLLHRADLQGVLAAAAAAHPRIDLRLGCAVDAVVERDGGIVVEARTSGQHVTIAADGFIDAGGVHAASGVDPAGGVRFSGRTAWRALVAADRLPEPFRQPRSNLWLGTRIHLVHYPLRGAELINVVVIVDDAAGDDQGTDPWAKAGDPAALGPWLRAWHPEPRRLVEAAETWRIWPLLDGQPGPRWSRGLQTAVGDAAHPMLPFLAQGASQAVEDAAALTDALVTHRNAVGPAFDAYEQVRRPVAERVQTASRTQGRIYHLGGPAAFARDAAMSVLGPTRMLARMDWLYGRQTHPLP